MGASPVVVTLGDSMKLDSGYTSETEGVGLTVGLNVKVRKGESFLFFSDEKFNIQKTWKIQESVQQAICSNMET